MQTFRSALLISLIPVASASSAVAARDFAPDRIAVAVGAIVAPDYEGSDDYSPALGVGALVRVQGRSITWKGTSLSVDVVPEYRDQTFKIVAGPLLDLNPGHTITPRDPVVAPTRTRKTALEGGAFVGFAKTGVLTSSYDTVSITLAAAHDLGSVHRSLIVTPSLDYTMPVSRSVMLEVSLSADVVGGRYARYYFGVDDSNNAQSGLPRYAPGGGVKSVSAGLGGVVALNGDLDGRGVLLGGVFNFERLLGAFAASPLVAQRGNANQASVAIGVGYRF